MIHVVKYGMLRCEREGEQSINCISNDFHADDVGMSVCISLQVLYFSSNTLADHLPLQY